MLCAEKYVERAKYNRRIEYESTDLRGDGTGWSISCSTVTAEIMLFLPSRASTKGIWAGMTYAHGGISVEA